MHIAYQNVHLRDYIISFHCIIFIWSHLDARNAVRRGLLELIARSVTPFSTFVIFAMINVCMLWSWALHVFCYMPCHLYRGAYHVFLWSMWWLAQACKLGFVMLLILVPVLVLFWCHVNLMLQRDPCIFWDTSVRMFWTYGYFLSIHALCCNYGVV